MTAPNAYLSLAQNIRLMGLNVLAVNWANSVPADFIVNITGSRENVYSPQNIDSINELIPEIHSRILTGNVY